MTQLPPGLSPLELLEQRSRRLATRLQDSPSLAPSSTVEKTVIPEQQYSDDEDDSESIYEDGTVIPRRTSSRHKKSTPSIGSILGNFRLSTFSIMDKVVVDDPQSFNNTNIPPSNIYPSVNRAIEYSTPLVNRNREYSSRSSSSGRSISDSSTYSRHISKSEDSRDSLSSRSSSYSSHMYSKVSSPQLTPQITPQMQMVPERQVSNIYSSISSSTPGNRHSDPHVTEIRPEPARSNSLRAPSYSKVEPGRSNSLRAPSNPLQPSHPLKPSNPLHSLKPSHSSHPLHSSHPSHPLQQSKPLQTSHMQSVAQNSTVDRDTKKPDQSFESLREKSLNNSLTLEEHVSLGILYHEKGNLRESSYHWQYAAFKNELTAMLLYGLALRHGWGIRQNPGEAAKWLRKVIGPTIDGYSLEDILKPEVTKSLQESLLNASAASAVKKAQIALALYELGQCYVNSWGVEKDEDMALRCFELAGSMGDVDALNEAAGLWMKNGPKGRKKNLMRAAKLYRTVGEKGGSTVSNSWIYKDKYLDKPKK